MFSSTGEFVDNTDNIISLTVSFINLFSKLLHSSSLSQFSYVPVIPCDKKILLHKINAVMYVCTVISLVHHIIYNILFSLYILLK